MLSSLPYRRVSLLLFLLTVAFAAAAPATTPQNSGIRVETLDKEHLPVGDRRLIFIGDIHGCREKLGHLLDKLGFQPETDHVVAVGDLVNKGPDTLGTIDFLRSIGASSVRGNQDHDVIILAEAERAAAQSSAGGSKKPAAGAAPSCEDAGYVNSGPEAIAGCLSTEQLAYLTSRPHILRIGELGGGRFRGETVVAHGGLVPGLALARQDPEAVMNVRALHRETLRWSDERANPDKGEDHWFTVWDWKQTLIEEAESGLELVRRSRDDAAATTAVRTVVYGHDSRLGLQLGSHHVGLDTRCSAGGQLTALVVGNGGERHNIVQVDCPDYEAVSRDSL
ncbi:hypothetical protein RB595_000171 [Gaeumannomyces hyphopodioides]